MNRLSFFVVLILTDHALCLESSTVKPKEDKSCGIRKGDVMVQKITNPVSQSSGLVWNEKYGKFLYFVERYNKNIFQWNSMSGELEYFNFNVDKELVSFHPVKNEKNTFIVGTDTSLYLLDKTDNNYTYKHIMNVVTQPNMVLMKGKTDQLGRLWYTSSDSNTIGKLYKVDGKNKVVLMESELKYPKGLAWSKDYKKFYLVDMNTKLIYSYDFNLKEGTIKNKKIVFQGHILFPKGGYPTDVTVDTDGNLWIGIADVGQVIKYDVKSGKILRKISIPANHITSLEFGLYKMKNLFVGTRKLGILSEPDSGSIFGISGINEKGFLDNEAIIPN